MVYVFRGEEAFHTVRDCSAGRRSIRGRYLATETCSAVTAYRSRLSPCSACTKALIEELRAELGSVPSGERRRLPMPRLRSIAPDMPSSKTGQRGTPFETASDPDLPYGAPTDADDLRFSNQSRAGWGIASYGQNHDEYLGESTDDDNDWRGGSRYLD